MDGDNEEAMRQRMAFFFLRGAGVRDGSSDGQGTKNCFDFA